MGNYISGVSPLKEILCNITAKYATVTPGGIKLIDKVIYQSIQITIVDFKPARTRYLNKKPVCRSFNGINPLKDKKLCATCNYKTTCTPQILLDFLYAAMPFRLLLAYTSVKNFFRLIHKCEKENHNIKGKMITLKIINRGRWGEVVFISLK